jgi:hypothetical protein
LGASEVEAMVDVVYVLGILAFAALTWALVRLCQEVS